MKKETIKKVVSVIADIVFLIPYLVIAMTLLGWFLDTSGEWKTITFGEMFDDSSIWFKFWIISLFYLPLRAILKGELWDIIFGDKKEKE